MDEIQIKSTYIYFLATPARGGPGCPVAATWSFLAPPELGAADPGRPGQLAAPLVPHPDPACRHKL